MYVSCKTLNQSACERYVMYTYLGSMAELRSSPMRFSCELEMRKSTSHTRVARRAPPPGPPGQFFITEEAGCCSLEACWKDNAHRRNGTCQEPGF